MPNLSVVRVGDIDKEGNPPVSGHSLLQGNPTSETLDRRTWDDRVDKPDLELAELSSAAGGEIAEDRWRDSQ